MARLISVSEVDVRQLLLQFIPNITGLKLQQCNTQDKRTIRIFKLLSMELSYGEEKAFYGKISLPINQRDTYWKGFIWTERL